MKNIRHNFNASIKLQECTSASNSTCASLSYIHFFNGHAYVSNTRIAIKADLTEISDFSEDEIKILHDKYISAERLRTICKEQKIKVTNEGFVSAEGILYPFQTPEEKFPDIEKLFQGLRPPENEKINRITLRMNELDNICKALHVDTLNVRFNKGNIVLLTFPGIYDKTVAIMVINVS